MSKRFLRSTSTSTKQFVARYIGEGKRGYLWMGEWDDDGYERFVLHMTYGQAKQLHAYLGEHLGPTHFGSRDPASGAVQ